MGKAKQDKLGYSSYDEHDYGTKWWHASAKDKPHQQAYAAIAKYVAKHVKKKKVEIIDFACGPGFLIKHLIEQLPKARITGVDESQQAIDGGKEYHASVLSDKQRKHIQLKQIALPNFHSRLSKADVVIFSFPDFRADDEKKWVKKWKAIFPDDWEEAKFVYKKIKKVYPDFEQSSSTELFIKRIAGRNLLSMCKKGGLVARVEYAACKRNDCDPAYLEEMSFYECTAPLDDQLKHVRRKRLTLGKQIGSRFKRSKVIQDVYAQTGQKDDKEGGFFITLFQKT